MSTTPISRPAGTNAALFGLWGLFWLAMFTVSMENEASNPYVKWWEPLLWEGSSALIATLWLLAQRGIDTHYQRYLDRPQLWLLHHLKWFPLIAVTFIVSIYAIRHGVYALVGREYHHEPWGNVFVYESVKLLLFASLWLGIIFGFNSFAQWRSERERLLELQRSLAESQLRQLQSQLRPHFLFNALNTISSLIHADPVRADRLLVRLGDLLRVSLQIDRRELASLREELQVLELYAQIMQERFVDRVALAWNIEPQALGAQVPSMLLQPLLENAFKHGVEKSQQPVTIHIAGSRQGDVLRFSIRNTGTLEAHPDAGIGLRNCRERLRLLYGDRAGVNLTQDGNEVVVDVMIPWQEQAQAVA